MGKKGSLFAKRIYAYIQDFDEQGRDLGEEKCVLALDKSLIAVTPNIPLFQKHIKTFNIKKMVMFRGAPQGADSAVSGALGGWMVAGPVGALILGMAGAKQKSWWAEIEEMDGKITLLRLPNDIQAKTLKRWKLKRGY